MNKKMDINQQKYLDYKKKKLEKWLYIIMSLTVIVLEMLALFDVINMFWGMGVFVILYLFKKFVIK